jgi:hypothetical protein
MVWVGWNLLVRFGAGLQRESEEDEVLLFGPMRRIASLRSKFPVALLGCCSWNRHAPLRLVKTRVHAQSSSGRIAIGDEFLPLSIDPGNGYGVSNDIHRQNYRGTVRPSQISDRLIPSHINRRTLERRACGGTRRAGFCGPEHRDQQLYLDSKPCH